MRVTNTLGTAALRYAGLRSNFLQPPNCCWTAAKSRLLKVLQLQARRGPGRSDARICVRKSAVVVAAIISLVGEIVASDGSKNGLSMRIANGATLLRLQLRYAVLFASFTSSSATPHSALRRPSPAAAVPPFHPAPKPPQKSNQHPRNALKSPPQPCTASVTCLALFVGPLAEGRGK